MPDKDKDRFTGKMFLRLWPPAILSSIGFALADMADSVVVGQRMGAAGLAAISLSLPVYMIMYVLMYGLGMGSAAEYSRLLGRGQEEEGIDLFNRTVKMAAAAGLILAAAGNLFLNPLVRLLGAHPTDRILYGATSSYIRILLCGMPFFFVSCVLNFFLLNDNHEKLASIGFTMGNICDILLSVVFVFFLDMGAQGAALSTVIGQMIAALVYLPGVYGKDHILKFRRCESDYGETFACFKKGFSVSVQYIWQMFFLLLINHILMKRQGENGVAVFDVLQNISYLVLYLYEGTAKAMQPIASTYCGEYYENGKNAVRKLGLVFGQTAGTAAILFVWIFPQMICRFFGLEADVARTLGVYALHVFCISLLFAGTSVLLEGYCQACGEEKKAFFLATLRGAVILIPCTFLFSTADIRNFWLLFPVTEIVSLALFLAAERFRQGDEGYDPARIYTRTINSGNEDLGKLLREIERFGKTWGANRKQIYFVNMAAEEICMAIMQNGFIDTSEGYIQVTLIADTGREFELHIRDNAEKFNPFSMDTGMAYQRDFNPDAVGIMVIKKKSKSFYYRQFQGFNTMVLRI